MCSLIFYRGLITRHYFWSRGLAPPRVLHFTNIEKDIGSVIGESYNDGIGAKTQPFGDVKVHHGD